MPKSLQRLQICGYLKKQIFNTNMIRSLGHQKIFYLDLPTVRIQSMKAYSYPYAKKIEHYPLESKAPTHLMLVHR